MSAPAQFSEFEAALRARLPYTGSCPLDHNARLADLGLDSLGVVKVLGDLESRFDIEFPESALVAETFETVESLWLALCATVCSEGSIQRV